MNLLEGRGQASETVFVKSSFDVCCIDVFTKTFKASVKKYILAIVKF